MSTLNFSEFDTGFHRFFDDFDKFTAADWTITTTEGGSGSATEAIANADGGVLVVTNDDAAPDHDFLQWAKETFTFETGKRLYFEARLKISDVTQSAFVAGLQVTDTSPLAVSDGIWFQSDDGDANLDFHVAASSVQTDAAAIATLVDDTYVKVAFYYDGSNADLKYIVNGVVLGKVALTNAPSTELTVSFGIQNGEAAAKVMSVDYIFVAKER